VRNHDNSYDSKIGFWELLGSNRHIVHSRKYEINCSVYAKFGNYLFQASCLYHNYFTRLHVKADGDTHTHTFIHTHKHTHNTRKMVHSQTTRTQHVIPAILRLRYLQDVSFIRNLTTRNVAETRDPLHVDSVQTAAKRRKIRKQDRQCTYNATLRRVRISIIVMEKQRCFPFVFLTSM
jgi:hypothetical protein